MTNRLATQIQEAGRGSPRDRTLAEVLRVVKALGVKPSECVFDSAGQIVLTTNSVHLQEVPCPGRYTHPAHMGYSWMRQDPCWCPGRDEDSPDYGDAWGWDPMGGED